MSRSLFALTRRCAYNGPLKSFYRSLANKAYPPHIKISMPALSPTMTAGNIGVWHKKVGDEIAPGDVLVEIETDKAQMDFECQEEGFLAKIFMDAGSKDVPVNVPIAVLAEKKEDLGAFADYEPEAAVQEVAPLAKESDKPESPRVNVYDNEDDKPGKHEAPQESAKPVTGRKFVSPIARKLGAEQNIPVESIEGTGPNGRVVKADVLAYKKEDSVSAALPAKSIKTPPATSAVPSAEGLFEDLPLSNMRKTIAKRLQESKSVIPHYYLTSTIEMDKVLTLRKSFNEKAGDKFKLSVNDFIIKAAAMALKAVPEVNSSWNETSIRRFHNVDICVAVSTPNGLITPIVSNADGKGLAVISENVRDLATRARDGKLAPNEYQGGTFTISNLGMFGINEFTAIINPPQSCILAVGNTDDKLVIDASTPQGFTSIKVMNVTLSCDHRVVDGAVGAKWLAKFRDYLENPLNMLL